MPISTLYSILNKLKNSKELNHANINILDDSLGLNQYERDWIKANIKPPQYPTNISKLDDTLSNIFGFKNRKRDIKLYLKDYMKYSYKKGSSMLKTGANENNLILQSIFSSRVLLDITQGKYIFNIDEASF